MFSSSPREWRIEVNDPITQCSRSPIVARVFTSSIVRAVESACSTSLLLLFHSSFRLLGCPNSSAEIRQASVPFLDHKVHSSEQFSEFLFSLSTSPSSFPSHSPHLPHPPPPSTPVTRIPNCVPSSASSSPSHYPP